jgi:predicted transcriptional regulator YdeE
MKEVKLEKSMLIGLSLKRQTSNQNGQSAIDCGSHWQEFVGGNYFDRIPDKLSQDIFAVYHQYQGDHTKPYSYFIGCKVATGSVVPQGLDSIILSEGVYQKIKARGVMPDCVANAWEGIWKGDSRRAYLTDFEVYGEGSKDWNDAEVEIYLSVVGA